MRKGALAVLLIVAILSIVGVAQAQSPSIRVAWEHSFPGRIHDLQVANNGYVMLLLEPNTASNVLDTVVYHGGISYWSQRFISRVYSCELSPTGRRVVIVYARQNQTGFTPDLLFIEDGKVLWNYEAPGGRTSFSPGESRILSYSSRRSGTQMTIFRVDGRLQWKSDELSIVDGQCDDSGVQIYAILDPRTVLFLNTQTGEKRTYKLERIPVHWAFDFGGESIFIYDGSSFIRIGKDAGIVWSAPAPRADDMRIDSFTGDLWVYCEGMARVYGNGGTKFKTIPDQRSDILSIPGTEKHALSEDRQLLAVNCGSVVTLYELGEGKH